LRSGGDEIPSSRSEGGFTCLKIRTRSARRRAKTGDTEASAEGERQLRRQLPLYYAKQLPLSPPLTPARCCILLTLTPLLPCLAPPRPIVHVYYQAGKKDYPGGYVYYPFEPTKSDPERLVP